MMQSPSFRLQILNMFDIFKTRSILGLRVVLMRPFFQFPLCPHAFTLHQTHLAELLCVQGIKLLSPAMEVQDPKYSDHQGMPFPPSVSNQCLQ